MPFKANRIAGVLRAASLLLLMTSDAMARAGGGGGFHGGGGGGGGGGFHGGGGGGGGGNNGLILWIIIQLIGHPVLGVLVLIIAGFLFWQWSQNQQSPGPGTIGRSDDPNQFAGAPGQIAGGARAASLRQKDPAFDENTFHSRVQIAFDKIQQAWCAQNLTVIRPFVSDGVYERFLLQIAEQRDEGYHDFMEGLRILDLRTAEIESDGIYDEIALGIRAVSVDYRMSIASGQRISGSAGPQEFAEVWTFVRRQGAQTRSGPGLIEGNCPNCGAAIQMNQSAVCEHCMALLRSGQYDWVLTEITQQSEWSGVRHRQIPGVQNLRLKDPDFNAAGIEDRASVAFWRVATAERLGKIDPIRKVASDQFIRTFEPHLRSGDGKPRVFYADDAVGSVRLLGIVEGGEIDQAAVEVIWNGTPFAAASQGPPRQVGQQGLFNTVLVFFRRSNAKTEVGKGIASAHCPNCGAPESGGLTNACEFCGTVLTDGTHGWVLDAFLPRTDPRSLELLASIGGSHTVA
jgi:predicted lipid-binding transport protein (Tim44 family)